MTRFYVFHRLHVYVVRRLNKAFFLLPCSHVGWDTCFLVPSLLPSGIKIGCCTRYGGLQLAEKGNG